jgi:hypothetical protein
MTACFCPSCCSDPAPTYLESFRHSCEVRAVAGLADIEARRVYLDKVRKARGEAARARIIEGLKDMKGKTP